MKRIILGFIFLMTIMASVSSQISLEKKELKPALLIADYTDQMVDSLRLLTVK